jgi:hypothetical protein
MRIDGLTAQFTRRKERTWAGYRTRWR